VQQCKTIWNEIRPLKYKGVRFKGRIPVIHKVVTDNATLEQANTFVYLGYKILYEEEKDT